MQAIGLLLLLTLIVQQIFGTLVAAQEQQTPDREPNISTSCPKDSFSLDSSAIEAEGDTRSAVKNYADANGTCAPVLVENSRDRNARPHKAALLAESKLTPGNIEILLKEASDQINIAGEDNMTSLQEILKEAPNNLAAVEFKAHTLAMCAKVEGELTHFEIARELFQKAQISYLKVLKLSPHNTSALYGLTLALSDEALIVSRAGRYAEATEYYKQSLKRCNQLLKNEPNTIFALTIKGLTAQRLAVRNRRAQSRSSVRYLIAASESYENAGKQAQDNENLYENELYALTNIEKIQPPKKRLETYKKIIETCDQIIRLRPNAVNKKIAKVEALYQKAVCLDILDERARAAEIISIAKTALNSLIETSPAQARLYQLRGKLLEHSARIERVKGNYKAALQLIEEAITAYKNMLEMRGYFADLDLLIGRAFWFRAIVQSKLNLKKAALESYEDSQKAFNNCMDREPPDVVKKFGRGDLVINFKTLEAKMRQGRKRTIRFEQADKAIELRFRRLYSGYSW